jgi:hypothetical protein
MGGFWGRGRARASFASRLGVAALVTAAWTLGALGALVVSGANPAGASGLTYYAYPAGGATTPLACPQTTTVADQCTLTEALAVVGAGDTVALAVSGDEGDPGTFYFGNFTVSGGGPDLSSPLTIEPAAGVMSPILDGNDGSATGCPTASCAGPVLTVPGNTNVDVHGLTFQNANDAAGQGGAIFNDGGLSVDSSTFTNNNASYGGAIASTSPAGGASLTVVSSTFTNNNALNFGGAIDNSDAGYAQLSVASSTFTNDSAVHGGAIDNADSFGTGSVAVSTSSFTGNHVSNDGGAIDSGDGGGLGSLTVATSSFSNNSAGIDGGSIDNADDFGTSTAVVATSTFTDNSAGIDAGAIDNGDSATGTATITTSTFLDNSAGDDGGTLDTGDFGGVGTMTVSGSTLSGGSAPSGGDIASWFTSTTKLATDIIVHGGAGGDCGGISTQYTDEGYDVNDDPTCPYTAADGSVKDSTAIDSYLGPLGLNGGPTETIPLEASPTSPVGPDPALDAVPSSFDLPDGTPACSVPDQRGVARTAPCDIGAFEVHPTNVATETTLVGSASSTMAGTSVTYTATVLPTTDDELGSAVTFTQDGSPATCTGSTFDGQSATCTIAYPTPGVHEVRATYGGDTVFAASAPSAPWTTTVSVVPLRPTSTALTSSATGVAPGQSLTLTATVSPAQSGSSPGTVAFDDDGQALSCGAGSTAFDGTTATCVISFPFAFQHQVTAVYSGDATATGSTSSPLLITVAFANPGYRVAAADGGVFAFGTPYDGSMGGQHLNAPIVGLATDTATGGYWLVASDGGVFSFNAPFYGSMGGHPLNAPIVGMAAKPSGDGYWLVASDGGVFAFGPGATFSGSMGGQNLNAPIVGLATDTATGGYWLVASDGGVFSFNAPFDGSTGGLHLNAPISGMAATADGGGYWLVGSDGGVFNYADATFHGSNVGENLSSPVVGIATDIYTGGYWLVAANGATAAYGAPGDGMFPDLAGASRAVAIAAG